MRFLSMLLFCLVFSSAAFAQLTPNCTDISPYVVYPPPLTQEQINSINASQQSQFPNVVKLAEPTSSYNCHNYAFVNSEGGPEFWLNTPGDDAFWNDASYVVSTSTTASNLKVSYQGDHTAVTTSVVNQAISKWGAWGLYRHNITDVPSSYLPNNTLTYYTRSLPTISGPSLICTNGSFALNNAVGNVSWAVAPTNLVSPSTGSGAVANFSKVSNGNGTITFTFGCNNSVVSTSFRAGPYSSSDYPIQGPDYATCNQYVYYSIPDLPGVTSINWSWPSAWTYVSGQGTRYLALRAKSYSSTVSVGVNNSCGSSGSYATKYTYVSGCGYSFIASPNPADAELTITYNETTEEKEAASYRETFSTDIQVALIDLKQVKRHVEKTSKKKFSIPTKHLEKGIYILHIVTSEGEEKQQIEINH